MAENQTTEECVKAKMADGMTEEEAKDACTKKSVPKPEEETLVEKMTKVIKEAFQVEFSAWEKKMIDMMAKVTKEKEEQFTEAFAESLGVPKNKEAYITLSEAKELLRKIVLESSAPGKRTETETKDKPTEGADIQKQGKSLEEQYAEMLKRKGTVF